MKQEQFNPAKFKNVQEMPSRLQKNFVESKDKSGFVRKEVIEADREAEEKAEERGKLSEKLFGGKGKVRATDISHEEALKEHKIIEEKYQAKIKELESRLGQVLSEEIKQKIYHEILKKHREEIKTKVEKIEEYEEQTHFREDEVARRNVYKAKAKKEAIRDADKIFGYEQRDEFQKSLDEIIPNMVELIKEKKIKYIVCLEKRARFFRSGLNAVFKNLKKCGEISWDVKVLSVAPDYFNMESKDYRYEDAEIADQRKKFLSQLPEPDEINHAADSKILLLDDYAETGKTMRRTKKGFLAEGFSDNSVLMASMEGDKNTDHKGIKILGNYNSIYYDLKMATQDVFASDDEEKHLYHARLMKDWNFSLKSKSEQKEEIIVKNELYLEISRRFKMMMLESLKKYINF